ncbi:flavin reductase family protein [Gordonia hydrophobica]|uniref:Flavin reductase family protein n=1 Tax=Gordonia hydrophobica TaxID=40516 RepID=A0ABZ2U3R8_9ACTN|nr:flavin reductase family protein [Gordonia hydrophobica]MBM7369004.1 flavin reductase (DIM6/NTAB) family NADH-FMN oxidoreductase RutF [Gordonia hydrophobica]
MTADVMERRFGADVDALMPAGAGSEQIRAVFNGFPAAVVALCSVDEDGAHGLVATSVSVGVSYDPPMVLFSVRKESTTWPALRRSPHLGLSVLGEDQSDLCRRLAGAGDRFDGVRTHAADGGALFIGDAMSWLDCTIESEVEAGDHTVVILRVHAVGHAQDTAPLVFHRSTFPVLRGL